MVSTHMASPTGAGCCVVYANLLLRSILHVKRLHWNNECACNWQMSRKLAKKAPRTRPSHHAFQGRGQFYHMLTSKAQETACGCHETLFGDTLSLFWTTHPLSSWWCKTLGFSELFGYGPKMAVLRSGSDSLIDDIYIMINPHTRDRGMLCKKVTRQPRQPVHLGARDINNQVTWCFTGVRAVPIVKSIHSLVCPSCPCPCLDKEWMNVCAQAGSPLLLVRLFARDCG